MRAISLTPQRTRKSSRPSSCRSTRSSKVTPKPPIVDFKINLFFFHNFRSEFQTIRRKLSHSRLEIGERQGKRLQSCFDKICAAKDLNIETVRKTSELKADYTANPVC